MRWSAFRCPLIGSMAWRRLSNLRSPRLFLPALEFCPGRQARPRTKLSPILELLKVTHCGHQGPCGDRANSHKLHGSLGLTVLLNLSCNTLITPLKVFVRLTPLRLSTLYDHVCHARQVISTVLQ